MGEAIRDRWEVELLRRVSENPAFDYYDRLGRVERYVRARLAEPVSLAEAARVAGLERCYFSTYFHQRANIRFRDWLSGLRTLRAMELIREQDRPFAMVSDAVGFPSQRAFQRTFRKWTGGTARDYRNRVRRRLASRSRQTRTALAAGAARPLSERPGLSRRG